MNKELILHAATLSRGAVNPMAYINTLLSSWMSKGIDTVEKAKADQPEAKQPTAVATVEKSYTSEQLNAMFDNLKYEDL